MTRLDRIDGIEGIREFPAFENLSAGDPVRLIDDNGTIKLAKVSNNPSISDEDNFGEGLPFGWLIQTIFLPDEDAVAVFYRPDTGPLSVIIGTVSGQTITWGTAQTTDILADSTYPPMILIPNTSKIAMLHQNLANTDIQCTTIDISGTTATFNASVTVYTTTSDHLMRIVYDTTNDRLVAIFEVSGDIYSAVGLVAGTTTTWSTAVDVLGGDDKDLKGAYYDSNDDKVAIIFNKDSIGELKNVKISMGQVITAPDGISWGTPVDLASFDDSSTSYSLSDFDPISGHGIYMSGTNSNQIFIIKSTNGIPVATHHPLFKEKISWQIDSDIASTNLNLEINKETGIIYYFTQHYQQASWHNYNSFLFSFSINNDGGLNYHTSINTHGFENVYQVYAMDIAYDSNEDQVIMIYLHDQDGGEMYSKVMDSPKVFLNEFIGVVENNYLAGETAKVVTKGIANIPSGGIVGKRAYLRSDGTIKSSADISSSYPHPEKIGIFLSDTQILLG